MSHQPLYPPDGPQRLDRPVTVVTPALYRESEASTYLACGTQTLANHRSADRTRLERLLKHLDAEHRAQVVCGELDPEAAAELSDFPQRPVFKGPRWINIGRAVRYAREDLDAWINAHRLSPWEGAA